jgi:hypothetical protein
MWLPPMAARDVGIVYIRLLVGRNSKGSHGHKYHAKSILPLLLLLVSTFYELASGIDLKSKSIAIGHHHEAVSHASLIHPSRRIPRHPNCNICRRNMWRTNNREKPYVPHPGMSFVCLTFQQQPMKHYGSFAPACRCRMDRTCPLLRRFRLLAPFINSMSRT